MSATIPPLFEIGGGLTFFVAYLGTTFISLTPAHFNKSNAVRFSQSAFKMLSNAKDEDCVALFQDVSENIIRIAELAAFRDNYRWAGLDHNEPTAFFDFIHRRTIDRSYFAGTLLRLMEDTRCCRAVICGDSIAVVGLLLTVSSKKLASNSLASLIQALARQSIIQDESMLAREVGYTGFAEVRIFMDAMFGDEFIARHHEPLRGVEFSFDLPLTDAISHRLAASVERTWKVVPDIWSPSPLWPASRALSTAFMNARLDEKRETERNLRHFHLFRAASTICETSHAKIMRHVQLPYASSLFADDSKPDHPNNLAGVTAELAVEALMTLSNDFMGPDDTHWTDTLDIMRSLFPSIGDQPDGLSPVQQRALMLIVKKLRDNMDGYYPALTRLLLAAIGPHQSHHQQNNTAFRILEDAAYSVWKDFARLNRDNPEKLRDFLPPNVEYDATSDTLIHTYRGGDSRETQLKSLVLPEIDPLDVKLHQAQFQRRQLPPSPLTSPPPTPPS